MKIAIIGCGNFGSILAYSLVAQNIAEQLVLINPDKNKALTLAYDLNQASPLLGATEVQAGGYENLSDADIIVIASGETRKEGETRLNLTNQNAPIIQDIVQNIVEYNTNAILIVATNPVDIMTYITLQVSGFNKEKVMGLGTFIDSIRMRYFISQKLKLNPQDINIIAIGEHGNSMVPLFSSANIGGIPLDKIIGFDELVSKEIMEKTRKTGQKLISLGKTPAYAPAAAATTLIKNIVTNSKNILPISVLVNNIYGIDNICMSMPVRVGSNGVEEIIMPSLSDKEHEKLQYSYNVISQQLDQFFKPTAQL